MKKNFSISILDKEKLLSMLENSHNIVVLTHTSPDGDALGAAIGLCMILQNIYQKKQIYPICPDYIDDYIKWMESLREVYIWGDNYTSEIIQKADLFIHLDHNELSRIRHKSLIDLIELNGSDKIMIDHHLYPSEQFNLSISKPEMSSTCELICHLIGFMGWEEFYTSNIATSLLTGIITDTGRFLYNCSSDVFRITSDLISFGADITHINDRLNYHSPLNRVRFHGFAIDNRMIIDLSLNAAVIAISKEDMSNYGVQKGDTEGLSNLPLEIEGVNCSCLAREQDNFVKLSFRSTGNFPANKIAEKFGGGGHLNAAGAEYYGNIEDAIKLYWEEVKELIKTHKI